eukprot:358266-Amphidinium_carterae.1
MVKLDKAPIDTPWLSACRWLWARCQQCLGMRRWALTSRVKGPPVRFQDILEPLHLQKGHWTLEELFQTLRTGGLLEVGLLVTDVYSQLTEAERASARERRANWKEWATKACHGGAAAAHRWLRGSVPVPPQPGSGEVGLVGTAALDKVAREWTDIWSAHEPVPLPDLSVMEALPEITAEGLRSSLITYGANKRGGTEGFNLRACSWLPTSLLQRFLDIIKAFEITGVVPHELATLTILMPKPGPVYATRPIGLSASVMRAWSRCRVEVLRRWERYYLTASHWGTAGRSCERAAWAHQLLVEGKLGTKLALGTWLVDLR